MQYSLREMAERVIEDDPHSLKAKILGKLLGIDVNMPTIDDEFNEEFVKNIREYMATEEFIYSDYRHLELVTRYAKTCVIPAPEYRKFASDAQQQIYTMEMKARENLEAFSEEEYKYIGEFFYQSFQFSQNNSTGQNRMFEYFLKLHPNLHNKMARLHYLYPADELELSIPKKHKQFPEKEMLNEFKRMWGYLLRSNEMIRRAANAEFSIEDLQKYVKMPEQYINLYDALMSSFISADRIYQEKERKRPLKGDIHASFIKFYILEKQGHVHPVFTEIFEKMRNVLSEMKKKPKGKYSERVTELAEFLPLWQEKHPGEQFWGTKS